MNNLISQCNDLMKDCGFSYAICGGYALELFLNKKIRSHSDVDLSIFEEDRAAIVKFLISKGWNLYERLNGSLTGQLRLITDSETVSPLFCIWAIKSDCSFFKIEPETNTENIYNYEIISNEQIYLDFIEILFNKREEDNFVFDSSSSQGKHITRKLSKAILYTTKSIPYLAPEVKLLMIANPVYMDSDYHGTKNQTDFEAVAPKLLKFEEWLTDKDFAKKTIDSHVSNVNFYINHCLVYDEPQSVTSGCNNGNLNYFFGYWFSKKHRGRVARISSVMPPVSRNSMLSYLKKV